MSEIPSLDTARWRKSSYSGLENDCVEVADGFPGFVPVRDSKAPDSPAIVLGSGAWSAFVAEIKAGPFPATD
ncbi:DUF397 domain-containing protein [Streptomyces olivoreticuli]|uniref:DUF397 domain-containing protein n=1 Tax=Streptomyces olivoreticuli TaxID=68246 RepID=UPI0026594BF6|nr:DUF397 domain-containing protein [Streptomyces olivoreticuli]WKK25902.1 DUF397 domain-containing protein [Streptomyces olivoreticuli]